MTVPEFFAWLDWIEDHALDIGLAMWVVVWLIETVRGRR